MQIETVTAEQVGDMLRDRTASFEFWFAIFDGGSHCVLEAIENRYYSGPASEDLTVVAVHHRGHTYGLASMRKRRMLSHQYQSLLRQVGGLVLTEREILRRDHLVIVAPGRMAAAVEIVNELFMPARTET